MKPRNGGTLHPADRDSVPYCHGVSGKIHHDPWNSSCDIRDATGMAENNFSGQDKPFSQGNNKFERV